LKESSESEDHSSESSECGQDIQNKALEEIKEDENEGIMTLLSENR